MSGYEIKVSISFNELSECASKASESKECINSIKVSPHKSKSSFSYPKSYHENSDNEKKILTFIENLSQQYEFLYPKRMPLMLCPLNECGVPKFVCTTIKPCALKAKTLIDYKDAADFVGNFVSYKFLESFNKLPDIVNSPASVLKSQSGNCFEISILLASILIGLGYNAFVVSGYSSREICYADHSALIFDNSVNLRESERIFDISEKSEINDYEECVNELKKSNSSSKYMKFFLKNRFESKYDIRMREKIAKEAQEKTQNSDVPKKPSTDEDLLKGLRVHAWVLCLPKSRLVKEGFFIESSTGSVKDLNDENYHGIESMWNNKNYWINHQNCDDGVKGLSYDLDNEMYWEKVFKEVDLNFGKPKNEFIDDDEDSLVKVKDINLSEYILLQNSWVSDLNLSKSELEKLYQKSQKTKIFYRTLVKNYAPFLHKQGCLTKILEFKDDEMTELMRTTIIYDHRVDKLQKKIIDHIKNITREFYSDGRKSALVAHQYENNVQQNERKRIMIFNPFLRFDNLKKRNKDETTMEDFYMDRKDFLFYRKVKFESKKDKLTRLMAQHEDLKAQNKLKYTKLLNYENAKLDIVNIIERYNRDYSKNAYDDLYQIVYDLKNSTIKLTYHRDRNFIVPVQRKFTKPSKLHDIEASLDKIKWNSQLYDCFEANFEFKAKSDSELTLFLYSLMAKEKSVILDIRRSENETIALLKEKANDDAFNELKTAYLDIDEKKIAKYLHDLEAKLKFENLSKEKELKSLQDMDYLQPYISEACADELDLKDEEKSFIKSRCFSDIRTVYTNRANTLQKRYDIKKQILQKNTEWYKKNKFNLKDEQEEVLLKEIDDYKLHVEVLNNRLNTLKTEARNKYVELERKIRTDPRLSQL